MAKPTMLRNTLFNISIIIIIRIFLVITTRLITCPSPLHKGRKEKKNREDKGEGRGGLLDLDTLGAADRKSCLKEEEGANRPLAGCRRCGRGSANCVVDR